MNQYESLRNPWIRRPRVAASDVSQRLDLSRAMEKRSPKTSSVDSGGSGTDRTSLTAASPPQTARMSQRLEKSAVNSELGSNLTSSVRARTLACVGLVTTVVSTSSKASTCGVTFRLSRTTFEFPARREVRHE